MFPYRGKHGGCATEGRTSIRSDRDHFSSDFRQPEESPKGRDVRRIGCCPCPVNSRARGAFAPCQSRHVKRIFGRSSREVQDHMQAIGLCRFSYPALGGYQVQHETIEDRMAYLFAKERLEERFRLFETVALPCLRAQTDPDFHLVILIGDAFPKQHEKRLEALINDVPQALIHKEPPRQHREVASDVLNQSRLDPSRPCLQFRYDDDDAVAVDFIEKLRQAAEDCAPLLKRHRSVAFDWNGGVAASFGADGIHVGAYQTPYFVAALGMYVRGNCNRTIMNFAHNKVHRHMPTVTHPDKTMFVRGLNAYNDSRQGNVAAIPVAPATPEDEAVFRDRFAIDAEHVRRVFSAP